MRQPWIAQILREHRWIVGNLLPTPFPPPGSTFSGLAARLPQPESAVERSLLRGLLIDVSLEWGEAVHRAYHGSRRSAASCRFAARATGLDVWVDRAKDPRVAFEEWAARYRLEFDRLHPLSRAARLRDHIDTHFSSPLRVKQLAAEWEVTARLLQREFVALTGLRIQDYVATRRVQAACRMLRSTGEKVECIARAVGWSSRKNLNLALARHLGVSPNDLRLQVGPAARRAAEETVDQPSGSARIQGGRPVAGR